MRDDGAEFIQAVNVVVDTVLLCGDDTIHPTWPSPAVPTSCQTCTVRTARLTAILHPFPEGLRSRAHSSVGIGEAGSMSMAIHVNLNVGREGIGFGVRRQHFRPNLLATALQFRGILSSTSLAAWRAVPRGPFA